MTARDRRSTALLTDHYELTMLRSAIADGTADRRATFEVFARSLKDGNRFGVFAGLGRMLDALEDFTFTAADLAWLREQGVIDEATHAWLDGWTFTGRITTYAEGELYFPGSPVVTVEGRFGDAVLLETLILSVVNHDSAIATKAARMRGAAGDRSVLEMGSRRTHEGSAVAAARAAMLVGFDATSNLQAGRWYGVTTMGTAAHAWTQAHRDEASAFDTQIAVLGADTTLLVDTYDIEMGVRAAVAAANRAGSPGPGAVRIDSGDLALEAKRVRRLLDDLGALDTRIVVSGDLDEDRMAELATSPVDAYGVGTRLVSGLTAPGFVYKLVEIADGRGMRPVHKSSEGKRTIGGHKRAWRELTAKGHVAVEHVATPGAKPRPTTLNGSMRPLQVEVWDGTRCDHTTLAQAAAHHRRAIAELTPDARQLHPGTPAVITVVAEPS